MATATEKEYNAIQQATIYEIRQLFTSGEKENYTKEEIANLLDTIAEAKAQE